MPLDRGGTAPQRVLRRLAYDAAHATDVPAAGRKWQSVRDAFWRGELGFPDTHAVREQLEFLLRVLLSFDMADRGESERRFDLFRGNLIFLTFYMCCRGRLVDSVEPHPPVDHVAVGTA
ncbi:hypothetical protein ACQR50_01925 [Sphingomonas sp. Xoc002]|uniref:hypothetical protein n=1 Tax=Sphingomonas sp. Xoc002 TaxID=2837624 RepID=UPI003D177AC1